jgi:hypothetical protein
VGGLGESDHGCIFVVKYILSVLMVYLAGQAVLCVIHTAHREHAGDWENLMFVYLCRTVHPICTLVHVAGQAVLCVVHTQ